MYRLFSRTCYLKPNGTVTFGNQYILYDKKYDNPQNNGANVIKIPFFKY